LRELRYRFQTREFGEHDIHYRALRDRQEYDDRGGEAEALGISSASWPLFGVVWQAGEVLAKLMASYDIANRRILEVGCGVGLASLVLNKRQADISATDIHPSANRNLRYNTRLNNDRDIPFLRTAWEDERDEAFGLFDLIIGSDVLFEPDHAVKLAEFIELYAGPKCEVILVDANRGLGPKFTRGMEAHNYTRERLDNIAPFTDPETYKGRIQRYRRG
jgi:predicted nicotinamide N-methyase